MGGRALGTDAVRESASSVSLEERGLGEGNESEDMMTDLDRSPRPHTSDDRLLHRGG